MQLIQFSSDLKQEIQHIKAANQTIGFVPTMGALHEGHLSLVKEAKKHCDVVIVSIYVNPTQFNKKEDLDKYPRALEQDMELLKEYVNIVFNPQSDVEIYGEEIQLKAYDFGKLDEPLEGAFRPGHFRGMANVVSKFFALIQPNKAFFGLKDYQQYVLVKEMVKIDGYDIEVIGCPTVREESGLAMSSRNRRLSTAALDAASIISYTLNYCKIYAKHIPLAQLKETGLHMLKNIMETEYLEFRTADTLEEYDHLSTGDNVFLSYAGVIEGVRLIDNIVFEV